MWHRNREKVVWISTWVLFGCAVTTLEIGLQVAKAGHPPTPLPCAAEGVCLPKRETWGVSKTRWRPWPGEKAGLQPTQSAAAAADKPDDAFPPYERPSVDEEDLRGKPQKKKDHTESTAPHEESTPELPSLELEGRALPQQLPNPEPSQVIHEALLQLPAARNVNLQQSADLRQSKTETLHRLPSATVYPGKPPETIPAERLQEDLPPSLPASLRQLTSGSQTMGHHALATQKAPRQARTEPPRMQQEATPSSAVIPAAWQQSAGIRLINPAAAVSAAADGDALRQAIYYEVAE